jgi:hypothetical protein
MSHNNLLCVGGIADGCFALLEKGRISFRVQRPQELGDLVRVGAETTTAVDSELYLVHEFFADGITFLVAAPDGWNTAEMFRRLMGHYDPQLVGQRRRIL